LPHSIDFNKLLKSDKMARSTKNKVREKNERQQQEKNFFKLHMVTVNRSINIKKQSDGLNLNKVLAFKRITAGNQNWGKKFALNEKKVLDSMYLLILSC